MLFGVKLQFLPQSPGSVTYKLLARNWVSILSAQMSTYPPLQTYLFLQRNSCLCSSRILTTAKGSKCSLKVKCHPSSQRGWFLTSTSPSPAPPPPGSRATRVAFPAAKAAATSGEAGGKGSSSGHGGATHRLFSHLRICNDCLSLLSLWVGRCVMSW